MWIRKRLDIGWADLLRGLIWCAAPLDRERLAREIESGWSADGSPLVCLSVRSGFDLLLETLAWPPGSEVLISAVTIPDMVRILTHHQLKAIPVDIDWDSLLPSVERVRHALTPATRAIVVAHLFGSHASLEPLARLAAERELLLIEDCAQAYCGDSYRGDPRADASLFSFGPIKTATALGGAVVVLRNPGLAAALRERHEEYPMQSRRRFARRLIKYSLLKLLTMRWCFGLFVRVCRMLRIDYDRVIRQAARGFAGGDLFARLRQRPCAPLLALLNRRLSHAPMQRLAERQVKAQRLAERLRGHVPLPGEAAANNSYWVFPMFSRDPSRLVHSLARHGFDASREHSLVAVAAPADRAEGEPLQAQDGLEHLVLLPCYREMPDPVLQQLADLVVQCEESLQRASSGSSGGE